MEFSDLGCVGVWKRIYPGQRRSGIGLVCRGIHRYRGKGCVYLNKYRDVSLFQLDHGESVILIHGMAGWSRHNVTDGLSFVGPILDSPASACHSF
jgi:hypothetical protein